VNFEYNHEEYDNYYNDINEDDAVNFDYNHKTYNNGDNAD
jgi:hypothetical protein